MYGNQSDFKEAEEAFWRTGHKNDGVNFCQEIGLLLELSHTYRQEYEKVSFLVLCS